MSYVVNLFQNEAFLSGFVPLFGVLVGSFLSLCVSFRIEKKRLLIGFYAEFLSAYAECVPVPKTEESLRHLIASVQKLELICPKKALKELLVIQNAALDNTWNPKVCRTSYDNLQEIIQRKLRHI